MEKHKLFPILFLVFFATAAIGQTQEVKPSLTPQEIAEQQYQRNIKKERIYGVYIPRDIPDALSQLNRLTPQEGRSKFKNAPEEEMATKLHFSLGRWMIHNWNFYEGSRLSHHLRQIGVSHPDDQAKVLIRAYHRYLNKQPLKVKELANFYAEKRRKMLEEKKKEGKVIKKETRIRPN